MKIENALQKFLDSREECTFTLRKGADIDGIITEIGDGFVCVEEDGGLVERIINTEYIVSVYVYHEQEKKPKIKKKSIF